MIYRDYDKASENKIYIVVVCGPTASGKTDLGVRLALKTGGEIISADSMQIYQGMDIASAKPSEEEKKGIPHYLMGFLPPYASFSVADYVEAAHKCIKDIYDRGKLPIVVGGTGLYISSLVNNVKFDDTASDTDFRNEMKEFAKTNGNQALWLRLKDVDPLAAERIHPNNVNRVIRALEVFHLSGNTISKAQENSRKEESPYKACFIMPNFPRDILYERINLRVDKMLRQGLIEEAKEFFTHNNYSTSAQAIGYKELKPYLEGEKSLDECVEKLKQATRNYAKRQLTWFKKITNLNLIPLENAENGITNEALDFILEGISHKRIFLQ